MKSKLDDWNIEDVIQWIREYAGVKDFNEDLIRAHEINGRDLLDLTEDNLKDDLNIIKLHDRKQFLRRLKDLIHYDWKQKQMKRERNFVSFRAQDYFDRVSLNQSSNQDERFTINSLYNFPQQCDNFNNKSLHVPYVSRGKFIRNDSNLIHQDNINNISHDSEKLFQMKFDKLYNCDNEAKKIKSKNNFLST